MPFPRKTLLTLMAALAVAGCSTSGTDQQASAPAPTFDGRCTADNARAAIGQQATADLLEQSRVKAGAQVARVLKPHDMVTLEYRSDRLNLNADESGRITRVNCG